MSITTTTRNSDLNDLLALLQQEQDLKLDVITPATKLRSFEGLIYVEGASVFGQTILRPTDIFDGDIADKLGIPVRYLRKLREDHVDLYDANVNGWLHGDLDRHAEDGAVARFGPDGRKFFLRAFKPVGDLEVPAGDVVSFRDDIGIARSLQSDRYARTDHLDVLFAAMEGVNQSGVPVEFLGGDLSERRLAVRFASPAVSALAPELLKGYRSPYNGKSGDELPVVEAGFQITNSETGGGAAALQARFRVKVCDNGLVIDAGKFRQIHLGGRQDEGVVKVSQDTDQKRLALITAEARDAVATFLDRDFVLRSIKELEEKSSKPIADPAAVVESVGKALNFTEEARAGILDAFVRGGQVTAGGVLQAVTAYAGQVADPDVAFDLEQSAVQALELAYAA